MQALYSEQSLSNISRQLNRRLAVLYLVLGAILAVFIWAVITRTEWAAIVAACIGGCFAVFWVDMFCMPIIRYRRLVRAALTGRHHRQTLEYTRTEPDTSVVDGVPCLSLIFLGDPDKHGSREMLLYWDKEIPLPELESGSEVTVEYTGKNIIGIETAALQ